MVYGNVGCSEPFHRGIPFAGISRSADPESQEKYRKLPVFVPINGTNDMPEDSGENHGRETPRNTNRGYYQPVD
jgi:hypothetical protein